MKKKALSLALALAMCLGLTLPAFAASSDFEIVDCVDGDRRYPVLGSYRGSGGNVTIPSEIEGIFPGVFAGFSDPIHITLPSTLTRISYNAFNSCTGLTGVTIPSSITYIESGAFSGCTNLTDVTIPNRVTDIEWEAFAGCTSLTDITIPSSVTSLRFSAFVDCASLSSVTILGRISELESSTFLNCTSLTSVVIPSSVTSIEMAAFSDCTSLSDIYYGGSEAQWKAVNIDNTGDYNAPLLKAAIHYNSTGPSSTQPTAPVQPQQPAKPETASPTNDKLEVNGNAANPTVYKINSSNYFKIRDVAALLNGTEKQFAVGYDGEKNAVTATTGQGYAQQPGDLAGAPAGGSKTTEPSNDAIYVNGEKITAEVYKIGGSNYFKLRDLGKALNFYVGWSADRGMYIETDKPYS